MSTMALGQTFIDDESGHHAIPVYSGQLQDGRVICVQPETFEDGSPELDPEQWIEHIDKESVFIEGHFACYGEISYTRKIVTLRSGRLWLEPDWQQEVTVAGRTGLGYWQNDQKQYCPTHLLSGQALLPTFRTEQQVRFYLERMAEQLDWNQDVETIRSLEVWSHISAIAKKIAYQARRQELKNVGSQRSAEFVEVD